MYNKFGI